MKKRLVKQIDGTEQRPRSSNDKIKHLTHTPLILEYETQRQEMIGIVKKYRN